MIALGTNDVGHPGVSGAVAGEAVVALYERASRVPCLDVYVATIPPRRHVDLADVPAGNAVIEAHVPSGRVVPFGDQPVSDLVGGMHMGDTGQWRRAAMALATLFPSP